MRYVLDTNQVDALRKCRELTPKQKRNIRIVLPPRVWAEIAQGRYANERLQSLTAYSIRFGFDVGDLSRRIGGLTAAQIEQFEPLIPRESERHAWLRRGLRLGAVPPIMQYADGIKKDGTQWETYTREKLSQMSKRNRDRESRGEKINYVRNISNVNELIDQHPDTWKQILGWFFRQDEENRVIASVCVNSFVDAVMRNEYIVRFAKLAWHFHLSFADAFAERIRNVAPSRKFGLNDMTVGLYARSGDTILTNDQNLAKALRAIDPERHVRVATWSECVRELI